MLSLPNQAKQAIALPPPRYPLAVRGATIADLPFIDSLQKLHVRQVGWMPTTQLENKIARGHVLVAEAQRSEVRDQRSDGADQSFSLLTSDICPLTSSATPVGYCIGTDQYFKRDDVGIIYQMNVLPNRQRGLIGATLLKAMFERAAWGCKLFCCWCAKDIQANYFWESLGFVPLAFRAGSRGRGRVHIFWQRRIRAGDTTTPYWFPSQTSSGSIREDRIVLPIPPGMHWRDAMPMILPEMTDESGRRKDEKEKKKLTGPGRGRVSSFSPSPSFSIYAGGLRFGVVEKTSIVTTGEKKSRSARMKIKNDPRVVAAARELRDRWLESVNATPAALPKGKYEVGRGLILRKREPMPLLEAA